MRRVLLSCSKSQQNCQFDSSPIKGTNWRHKQSMIKIDTHGKSPIDSIQQLLLEDVQLSDTYATHFRIMRIGTEGVT